MTKPRTELLWARWGHWVFIVWKCSIATAVPFCPQCSGHCKTSPCDQIVGDLELFVALSVTDENHFLSLCLFFPYSEMKIKTFIHPAVSAGVCKTLRSPWIKNSREDQFFFFILYMNLSSSLELSTLWRLLLGYWPPVWCPISCRAT